MELLDRYLEAVKKHLPWQRQDDIIAELRTNLEAQLEDKEAALGRPLTKDETGEWLKQVGPPILVAARYGPQRYLIGPAIFPMYWYVLRMAFAWCVVIYSVVSSVQIALQTPTWDATIAAALHLPGILVDVAAWVTLVFVAIEYGVKQFPAWMPDVAVAKVCWTPESLPAVEIRTSAGKKPRSFAQAVAEVIFGWLLLVWLLLVPSHPYLLMGPGALYLKISPFQLAPVWWTFYWWIVGLNVLQLGWHIVELVRGRWQKPQKLQHIVMQAVGLIPLGIVLTLGDHALVVLKHPLLDQAHYAATLETINFWAYRGFLLIAVIATLQLVWDVGQLSVEAYRRRVAEAR